MLELRPCCECCGTDLRPDAPGAWICTFECTYCEACATGALGQRCPNCGGDLQPRPSRPAVALAKYPASTRRVVKHGGCAAA